MASIRSPPLTSASSGLLETLVDFFFKKQQVIRAVDEVPDPLMDLVNDLGELVKVFPPDLRGQ